MHATVWPCDQLGWNQQVGFHVRFDASRTRATRLLFVTEGVMLRFLETDRLLEEYDAIILDEVRADPAARRALIRLALRRMRLAGARAARAQPAQELSTQDLAARDSGHAERAG